MEMKKLRELAERAIRKGFHNLTEDESAAIRLVQAESALLQKRKEVEECERKVAEAKEYFKSRG
jgi:hypothetical protein